MNRCIFHPLMIVLIFALFFQVACKSAPVKPDEALTQRVETPGFFHNIPADSPYVLTGMEPIPLDVIKNMTTHFEAALETLFAFSDNIDADNMEVLREEVAGRVVLALLGEFRGNLSTEGLNKLGFSMQPSFAFYGIGTLPVFRMSLHDPGAFEALLQRIESAADIEVEHHKLADVSYRVYRYNDALFPLVIQGNEVIMGVTPQQSAEVYLPYMLGIKRPKESLANHNQIKEIIETYGLRPFMAGFVNLQGIGDALLQHRVVGSVMDEILQTFKVELEGFGQPSEVCRTEIRAAYSDMPRAVMGYEGFTATEIQTMFALEFESTLAGRLSQTRAPIPATSAHLSKDVMVSLGIGVDLQKFVDFLAVISQDIQDRPYDCEHLVFLNEFAEQFAFVSEMIPPFITDMRGLSVILKTLSIGQGYNEESISADAVAILKTNNPTELFQTLQMFLPFLESVTLDNETGTPVAIPDLPGFEFIKSPHIAKLSDTLGFSIGIGMQNELAMLLENDPIVASPLFLLTYDYARFLQLVSDSGSDLEGLEGVFSSLTGMLGAIEKSTMSLDAGPKALFMRHTMEFAPSNP